MSEYLDAMDAATGEVARPQMRAPATPFPRVLAALGPKMLELSRDRADGAHPFAATVAHTALARRVLGPDRLLMPEQTVAFDRDLARARAAARESVARHISYPGSPYTANLRRLGYGDEDFSGGGSERLVNDRIAWGDGDMVAARVREQLNAGADHVLVHPLAPDLPAAVDVLEELAPVLLGAGSRW
jgi:probable F420-dependent oxidoreductase